VKKRTAIRLISYLVAAAIVLSGMIYNCYKEMQFYKNQVRFTYSSSLEELNSSISNINLNLEKAAYVTTAKQMNSIAVTLYTEAKLAKNAFTQISAVGLNKDGFNKFLSQVGNYAVFVARKVTENGEIGDTERQGILRLGEISGEISKDIAEIENQYNNSGAWDEELSDSLNNTLENSELNNMFSELDENFTDYPTLIYDGPYSDYTVPGEPLMLKGKAEVSVDDAKNTAAKLLDVDAQSLKLDGNENGKIEAYRFVYEGGVASISVKGGHPVYFRKYTTDETPFYSYEQAVSIAQKYLSRNSEEKFIPTYYYADNGVCTVSFAYINGNVICYTDLVKIGVDLSSGAVVFYEGRGYLTNHRVRTLPLPKHSVDDAKAVVSTNLKIKSSSICVIPSDNTDEKQCYEFLCTGENEKEILVYINTQTLEEEEILMLFRTNGGTLVK